MERTVGEVGPALKENKNQINMIIGKLNETLSAKETEIKAFIDKHGLLTNPDKEEDEGDASPSTKKAQGVLV
jgi:hypothetical protein